MSLKAFHVVFVSVSILLTLGFGLWAVRAYLVSGSGSSLAMGVVSLLGCAALAWYGVWFLKKFKRMSYL